jgi:hypothetical protein
MVDRRVKIKDKWYEYISCNAQVKMTFAGYGTHAMDYIIKFDIKYLNDFNIIYNDYYDKNLKFEMRIGEIISSGCVCIIRKINYDENTFEVEITCDYFKKLDISEIRDEKLDIILGDEFS